MPYKSKKTGTKQEKKTRYNPSTGASEVYYVEVDVFEQVWEAASTYDYSSPDTSSYNTDTSYGSYE